MTTTILIVSLFFLLGSGLGAAVIWFVFRYQKAAKSKGLTKKTAPAEALAFRWKNVWLSVAVLLLALALVAYFYRLLPDEVAYRFNLDGSPKGELSREITILLLLLPQFLLTLTAGAITWGVAKLGRTSQAASGFIRPEGIISLMGNMIALPQIVIGFVMADIFSYNVYGIHLLPLWLFALIVMAVGGIALAVFFIGAIRRTRVLAGSSVKTPRSDSIDQTDTNQG